MAIYVATNTASITAQRHLGVSTRALDRSYQNLSSGLRINSARDDAAGLQISDRLTSQIQGLERGNRNALDGISMLQVAEGALDEITNALQRIRVLAIQSANGTNSSAERAALQEEVSQLSQEINRIADNTSFGGKKILNGEHDFKLANTGTADNPTITVRATMIFPSGANHAAQGVIDKYHEEHKYSFQVGADSYQTIDVKMGMEYTGNLTHYDEYGQYQCDYSAYGSNVATLLGFDLCSLYLTGNSPNTATTRVIDSSAPLSDHTTGFTVGGDQKVALDVSTYQSAQKVIDLASNYIQKIDSKRAEFGASQNRMESAIFNQENVIENVSEARSRIRDTDYAAEVARMTEQSILQQAGTSILTQANTLPQIAMTLLSEI